MALDGQVLNVSLPQAFAPLLQPARYKAAHGGRASGKSHAFAALAVVRCIERPTRIVCIRQVQKSLKQSVRQLIIDKMSVMSVRWRHTSAPDRGEAFVVTDSEIRHRNGSLIIFQGMQAYNADNIKSLEGFDIAWVEEAQTLSAISLLMLRPTMRKDGAELWFSWNPRHKHDPVDALLRGAKPPRDAVVIPVSWRDNPWFGQALQWEMQDDYDRDPDEANHVWGGGYQTVGPGAYYARLIQDAERNGRIGDFPHDPLRPVETSWDLGIDDYTSVWFWQDFGDHARVIDFFECQNTGLDDIVGYGMPETLEDAAEARVRLSEMDRGTPFAYGRHWLPHDVRVRELGSGARERAQVLRALGLANINKGVAANPEDRIAASRRLMPLVRFNRTPRVEAGIDHLRGYTKKIDRTTGLYLGPDKNGHDHAADAFGEFAINSRLVKLEELVKVDHVAALQKQTISDLVASMLPDPALIGAEDA